MHLVPNTCCTCMYVLKCVQSLYFTPKVCMACNLYHQSVGHIFCTKSMHVMHFICILYFGPNLCILHKNCNCYVLQTRREQALQFGPYIYFAPKMCAVLAFRTKQVNGMHFVLPKVCHLCMLCQQSTVLAFCNKNVQCFHFGTKIMCACYAEKEQKMWKDC